MKPLPKITAETRQFWEGCRNGVLRYQRCENCAKPQFPPRSVCGHCHATTLAWADSAGGGSVHTFTVVHRAPTEEFKAEAPYVLALIDFDEGFRAMMNVRGSPPESVQIGARVRVIFEKTERDDILLPQAKLA